MVYLNRTLNKIGFWSASLSALFGFIYTILQVFSGMKILPHPQNLVAIFITSLLLAPTFLITMISLHYAAKKPFRIYTAIGVGFAILYCGDITLFYFTRLVLPIHSLSETPLSENLQLLDGVELLTAVDFLSYFFMSLSTFFASFAFKGNIWLERSLLWNGGLMPVLLLAFYYPVFYFVGAIWMVTFPLAMITIVMFFKSAVFTLRRYETTD